MLLSDELIYAIDPIETSYIDFSNKDARTFFEQAFEDAWVSAIEEVSNEYYDFDEDEMEEMYEYNRNPLTTSETENGFCAVFEPLYILDIWGSRAWPGEAITALECAINETKNKFPDIEYSGCIQYFYSDSHAGDTVKFEINTDKIHPFVGNAIAFAAADEDFWEKLEDAEDIEEIKDELERYEEYLNAATMEKIRNLGAENV